MDTPRIPPPSVSKLVWKIIEVRDGAPKANRFRGSSISAEAGDCKAKSRHSQKSNEAPSKGIGQLRFTRFDRLWINERALARLKTAKTFLGTL